MKKLILLVLALSLAVPAWAVSPFQERLQARTATFWIEGQALGDMVLGARARLSFVLVDATLARDLSGNPEAPEWLSWHGQHYGAKGKTLFIVRLKTLKPMTFDPTLLHVGDHQVTMDDVLTRQHFLPQGDLPSGLEGTLALRIPTTAIPKKGPIPLGYGDWGMEWTAPR